MNDVRTAILKAADSIEKNPDEFNFQSCKRPVCGAPGCALGWIGFYAEIPAYESGKFCGGMSAVADLLGMDSAYEFYQRMQSLGRGWMTDADICAKNLRAYADKFHPADKPNYTGIPESVRSLFNEQLNQWAEHEGSISNG